MDDTKVYSNYKSAGQFYEVCLGTVGFSSTIIRLYSIRSTTKSRHVVMKQNFLHEPVMQQHVHFMFYSTRRSDLFPQFCRTLRYESKNRTAGIANVLDIQTWKCYDCEVSADCVLTSSRKNTLRYLFENKFVLHYRWDIFVFFTCYLSLLWVKLNSMALTKWL